MFLTMIQNANDVIANMLTDIKQYSSVMQYQHTLKVTGEAIAQEGITRGSIIYLNDGLFKDLFTSIGKEDLLDYHKVDYDPKNNTEISKEIVSAIEGLTADPVTAKTIVSALQEQMVTYNNIQNQIEGYLKSKLSSAIQELSNTSKEVIPAKVKEFTVDSKSYPQEFLNDEPIGIRSELVTRSNLIEHLEGCEATMTKVKFLSENLEELKSGLLLCKKQNSDCITRVLRSLNLFTFYQRCS